MDNLLMLASKMSFEGKSIMEWMRAAVHQISDFSGNWQVSTKYLKVN